MSEPSANSLVPESSPPERIAARREHFLHSLFELNRELTVALDVYGTADLLLFNLMGQLGTARAALWLLPDARPSGLVMVRCHGFERGALRAVVHACESVLLADAAKDPSPLLSWKLAERLEPAEFQLMRQVDLALVAPLHGGSELLGILALGSRVDGEPFGADDLETLETALGMVGRSLQNSRLYNRVLENNRKLRISNERLLEHDRLKEQFLSNVNHELRTPLAVVLATLECLVELAPPGDRSRDLLAAGLQKTHHLRRLIENLLVLSEATQDKLEVHLETTDVVPVLDAFVSDRHAGMAEALREFVYEAPPRALLARFDPSRLVQILNELLDNAVKFTSAGAMIRLRAGPEDREGTFWIAITLQDDGPGILPERMNTVFQSFEQADGSSTRRFGGLGVGLTFARELATRMGCELEVQSPPGEGTTCTIRIPAA
jgi:signal transduction histidine kinase